jgi:UDP-N-acetyl-D-glucosamine dehydrogenase
MDIISKLNNRTAIIGVVGLGYVGLPLALRFDHVGFRVLGFDVDQEKIVRLNRGETYIGHISSSSVAEARGHRFEATSDFSRASEVDALIICVPTPLNRHREPDLSFIIQTVETLAPRLRPDQVMSLESTTYPGTTDEELAPRLQARGFTLGTDYYLIFSPEREDPGNSDVVARTVPRVCGGFTAKCLSVGMALYGTIVDRVVPVSSTRAAELTKLLENIHRAVNIGLVNEMKIIAERMGIDIFEVIDAAATKPFGFVPYYPGPGLGGHCIPVDPFYLTWKAREFGIHTRFIELAGEINSGMPRYVVDRLVYGLSERGKPLKGSSVLVLGIAYKRNVDDMRESPAVEILELLRDKGARVAYSDPHVRVFPKMRAHSFDLTTTPITEEALRSADAVVVATDHAAFDYEFISRHAQLIVDARGVYRQLLDNVVRA